MTIDVFTTVEVRCPIVHYGPRKETPYHEPTNFSETEIGCRRYCYCW
jgi:hypothetical protein